ncbi:unnamed protein product [Orchesella dallaii]|uniref:Uncharacterized protein n=1 Tax=Orchesella dallaii TaxID=48710 RepID=A0ABP1PSP0_9HEXA
MANPDDPFQGRGAVKVVAIVDVILAAMLLCFYGVKWVTHEEPLADQPFRGPITLESVIRHQAILIWTSVIIVHSMQLVMSLVLLSGVYDEDAEDALGKCQMWWCSALTLFMVLALEAAVTGYLMLNTSGMQPISMAIFFLKLIFRLIAVTNVRKFMKNLKKAPPSSVHQKVYIRSKTIGPPPSNYIRY